MSRKKYSMFCKGDVIRTNPEKGFYGIAVVLDDGQKIELSPGHWSYPLCHIAITPLLFQYEVSENGFHACGDVNDFLGRAAYISWCRERGIELG